MVQSSKADNMKWWPVFKKHAQALNKLDTIPTSIKSDLVPATRLFQLFKEDANEFRALSPEEIQLCIDHAEALYRKLQQLISQSQQPETTPFYEAFAQSIRLGLLDLDRVFISNNRVSPGSGLLGGKLADAYDTRPFLANKIAEELYQLKRDYLPVMEQKHEESKKKDAQNTIADEADRIESFYGIVEVWSKYLYAIEYVERVLTANLETRDQVVEKPLLPLQFRLERNKPNYTVRLIRASYQKPTSEDVTILDVIDAIHEITVFRKDGKTLIDEADVIRFVRLHSVKDDLLNFKKDSMSHMAAEMYQHLLTMVSEIRKRTAKVIELINKTPMRDIEYAFAGINPEECKNLLRLKFQSKLPAVNEDHYRRIEGKKPGHRSPRTIEIMEEYNRNFEKAKTTGLSSMKPTLAMAYWLRKMLTSVIRNNQSLKKQAVEKAKKEDKDSQSKSPADDQYVMVGLSYTIGEEDFANFYINPDDIIGSDMSIQRVDRTDQWIAVRKSDKTHRIRKMDFFGVVRTFIEHDLNQALERFHLKPIDLTHQLLPEIQERLGDSERIDILRSGILGTTLTNLEEYRTADKFHTTFRRYFKKAEYDNVHYPDSEKLRNLAIEISNANTSILQMKFRRVLRIIEEIDEKRTALKKEAGEKLSSLDNKELEKRVVRYERLYKNIIRIKDIMVFAKPALKDVKLEIDSDVIIIKSNQ